MESNDTIGQAFPRRRPPRTHETWCIRSASGPCAHPTAGGGSPEARSLTLHGYTVTVSREGDGGSEEKGRRAEPCAPTRAPGCRSQGRRAQGRLTKEKGPGMTGLAFTNVVSIHTYIDERC